MKLNWISGIIFLVLTLGIFAAITAAAKADKKFETRFSPEVPQTVGKDGRYTAGSPALYHVRISKALAWEKSKSYSKAARKAGVVLLIAGAIFLALYASGRVLWSGNLFFVLLALAFAAYLSAYLSAKENNWIEFTEAEYSVVGKDPALMEQKFIEKALIR